MASCGEQVVVSVLWDMDSGEADPEPGSRLWGVSYETRFAHLAERKQRRDTQTVINYDSRPHRALGRPLHRRCRRRRVAQR